MFSLISGFYEQCTRKPTFKVLIVGCDNSGKTTLLEQVKKLEGLKCAKNLEKIPPTIGLNIAKITKSQGEFVFWDVGGQKSLRKIWGKYFSECNGVVFLIDGSDESRFEEVKEVLDSLYTRKVLDDAGIPKIQKGGSTLFEDDMESGGGAYEDLSIYQIL